MDSTRLLVLHPKAQKQIWKWITEQEGLFPLSKNWLILISHRQDAQTAVTRWRRPHSDSQRVPSVSPREKNVCHVLAGTQWPRILPPAILWGGELRMNLTIALALLLLFLHRLSGWGRTWPRQRKWGFCKEFTAWTLFPAWLPPRQSTPKPIC